MTNFIPNSAKGIFCLFWLMGFALLYPSYVGVSFVGWVERSETHQFKLAVIEDQQARYRHADTRWVNRGYQLSIQFGFNTLIIKAFIC